jgi:imidazolonepropionase-like amidohydrolase
MWIAGRPRSLRVEHGRIVETGPASGPLLLVPAVIDAHVHLAFAGEVSAALIASGVAAVLDLGAPLSAVPFIAGTIRANFAGPMLTAPRGYPTQSWGRNGFGAELSTPDEALLIVQQLAAKGARFAKLSFDSRYNLLSTEVARAAADEAHRLGMLVAAHALDVDSVRLALDAGCDVLAHTPREELPADVLS